MSLDISNGNDSSSIIKIKSNDFDFELFSTPQFAGTYISQVNKELTGILIRQMAKGVSSFIDVGAHYGFYDVLVGKSNPNCEIFTFEPVEENYEILQNNLTYHGIEANIFQKAVSSDNDIKRFEVSKASDSSGFIANPDFDILKTININTVTIDSLINQITKDSILIKINAVGGEIAVLEGMKKTIEKFDDIRLIVHFNRKCLRASGFIPSDLFTKLNALGFQIHLINEENRSFNKVNENEDWEKVFNEIFDCNFYCMKKDKALNLCFFSHTSQLAGAERRLINLTNELISEFGALCTIILPKDGPLKEKLHKVGCATLELPYHWWCLENKKYLHKLTRRLNESYLSIKFSESINKLHPDIIITNTLVIPWGAVFAYENAIPHLWMVNEFGKADHGFFFFFGFDKTIQFIESYSDKIITCSNAVKNDLFNSSERAMVVYDSLSNLTQKLTSIEPSNDVFMNDEAFHLLMIGTISIGKGQLDAVNAVIELIKNRGKKIEFVLIGYSNSDYKNEIAALIQLEDVQDEIRILPFRDDVYPAMKSADLILLCSRKEAFGRVIAEGMLLKKPVIGTNSGGIPELIQDGKTGFLYSPGNYFQLADQIQEIIENPELRNLMAENGKSFAMGKFSKQEFSGKFHSEFVKLKGIKKENSLSKKIDMTSLYQAVIEGCNVGFPDIVRSGVLTEPLESNEQIIYNLETQLIEREQEILSFAMSNSWVITRPLRKLMRFLKGKDYSNK